MNSNFKKLILIFGLLTSTQSFALDVEATAKALRLVNVITGGLMPTNDPTFSMIVSQIKEGNLEGAALTITQTQYFGNYLAKRLAYQMQSPSLTTVGITDSDATAFLIAHFTGAAGTKPSISTIWSENATYSVSIAGATPVKASSLSEAQSSTLNWQASLVRTVGQKAKTAAGAVIDIPAKHVGGYTTLSDKGNDNSFAMYGATAGTNLRFIEGIWRIATGLNLVDVQSNNARPQDAPRFIPEYDPNFFIGNGQASCMSCHGGGMSSLNHGYSAVADIFDYTAQGLVYIAAPTTQTRKSLGSDAAKRATNLACDLSKTPTAVCNPDSLGADPNQAWDLSATWANTGVLLRMGWTGPTQGEGLNALGTALGQSAIVYQNFTKRVITEICPMGVFTQSEINKIADAANPYAAIAGTDDIRTIVSKVAVHKSCL